MENKQISRSIVRPVVRSLVRGLTEGGYGNLSQVYFDPLADDGGDGASFDTAFNSFSDWTPAENTTLRLADGTYSDGLRLAGLSKVKVVGSGAAIIDGSEVVTGWTLNGTNNYEKSVVVETSATARIGVTENGILLTRQTSTALVEANPGSWYAPSQGAMTTSPILVTIHPTGSGNPNSNGSTYQVTSRLYAIEFAGGSGNKVSGVVARHCGNNNGAISIGGTGSTISNCESNIGGKHNLLIGSGTVSGVRCFEATRPTTAEPTNTVLVAYLDVSTGQSATFTDCVVDLQTSRGGVPLTTELGLYAHAATVGPVYDAITLENSLIRCVGSVVSALANVVNLSGCQVRNSRTLGSSGSTFNLTDNRIEIVLDSRTTCSPITSLTNNLIVCTGDTNIELLQHTAARDITFENTTIVLKGATNNRILMNSSGVTGGTITANYSVFFGRPQFGSHLRVDPGASYVGDHNIFCAYTFAGAGPNQFSCYAGGAIRTTLSAWQSTTGQDANSVWVSTSQIANFWLGDPLTGDYRINPSASVTGSDGTVYVGEFPDGTPLTNAGVAGLPLTWDLFPSQS